MDAPSHSESATPELTATEAAAVEAAARENVGMDELLETMEAELARHDNELESWDFEGSIRAALEGLDGIDGETPSTAAPAGAEPDAVEEPAHDDSPATEPVAAVEEDVWAVEEPVATVEEPAIVVEEPVAAAEEPVDAAAEDSLEAVELELALHNQNLISLGFEESIRTALAGVGGEMLFQMRLEREDCQRIAAVRIGQGEEQQFALVIMPPGGGLMRVEPVEQSSNPLARITESYAGLMDTFRAAA